MLLLHTAAFSGLCTVSLALSGMSYTGIYKNPLDDCSLYSKESLSILASLLVEKKYDVNGVSGNRYPPLANAIIRYEGAATLLLDYGAAPNLIFSPISPITPLIFAILYAKPIGVKLLLENGAKANLATKHAHPLFALFTPLWVGEKELLKLAILLRAGLHPLTAELHSENIFEYMKQGYSSFSCKSRKMLYRKAGRALVQYKILWNHLHKNWNLPPKIAEQVLTFVDFGLDDYHAVMAKCAICYDDKKFAAIPCSKNKHTDSICGDCIGKLTDCPLCREKLTK